MNERGKSSVTATKFNSVTPVATMPMVNFCEVILKSSEMKSVMKPWMLFTLFFREGMPSLVEYKTLLRLRRSGLPKLGSVVLRYPSLPCLAGVAGPGTEHSASGALRFPAHHRLHARAMHRSLLVTRAFLPPGPCTNGHSFLA